MNQNRSILTFLFAMLGLLAAMPAFGQLEVRLEPLRRDYILGEDVHIRVMVTNHTDAPAALVSTPGRSWLYLNVMRRGDVSPVAPTASPRYPNITIPPGSRKAFDIKLEPAFKLRMEGMYSVTATLRMPDMDTTYTSNSATFNVNSGGEVQSFRVQVRGQKLILSVRSLLVKNKNLLFGQVINADTHIVQGACFLGQYLNFMKPRVMLDSAQNLHLLCQSTPKFFTYSVMSTYGERREYKIMRQIGGPVDLVSTGKGIRCVGVAPYVKPKGDKANYHSASERP